MSFIIVGANGNFSTQLQEIAYIDNPIVINKSVYSSWENYNSELISNIYSASKELNLKYLINTVGIISKNHDIEFIKYWNVSFPKHLYQVCQDLNLTLVTLGSVHENIREMCSGNPYLESKRELQHFLFEHSFKNSIHFQFHTWYGGKNLQSEMFLGQIINSLKHKTIFVMSDGKQMREYHHVFDDASCVLQKLNSETRGVNAISHGDKYSLREIAYTIFRHFNCESQLKLNQINSPAFEIREDNSLKLDITDAKFRPTMKGIIDYVEKNI